MHLYPLHLLQEVRWKGTGQDAELETNPESDTEHKASWAWQVLPCCTQAANRFPRDTPKWWPLSPSRIPEAGVALTGRLEGVSCVLIRVIRSTHLWEEHPPAIDWLGYGRPPPVPWRHETRQAEMWRKGLDNLPDTNREVWQCNQAGMQRGNTVLDQQLYRFRDQEPNTKGAWEEQNLVDTRLT